MSKVLRLSEVVGSGYNEFWNNTSRYRVVKGGRASKKSTTMSLWIIYKMYEFPLSNTLVVRRFFNTHRDSTYKKIIWAINRLGVQNDWIFSLSPLEITNKNTGQKIMFKGYDNPESLNSITVSMGFLNFVFIEEAFQITNEEDFNKLDFSIRGIMPEGYFNSITLLLNPWNSRSWIKRRFFDKPDDNTFTLTTTYKQNEFLSDNDIKLFESMKKNNPKRYLTEGLAQWGISEGLVYENWTEKEFDKDDILNQGNIVMAFGIDWGFSNDPTAFIACLVDKPNKLLYIFDEYYKKGMTNNDIAIMIKHKGYDQEKIMADSAEPKSIEELKRLGIRKITPAMKGADSILFGIQRIQSYKIIVHPRCQNIIVEFNNYSWDTKDGQAINKPIDDFNHGLDSLRYIMTEFEKKQVRAF